MIMIKIRGKIIFIYLSLFLWPFDNVTYKEKLETYAKILKMLYLAQNISMLIVKTHHIVNDKVLVRYH